MSREKKRGYHGSVCIGTDAIVRSVWRTDEAQSAHREPELLLFIPSCTCACADRSLKLRPLISFVRLTRRANSTCTNDAFCSLLDCIAFEKWLRTRVRINDVLFWFSSERRESDGAFVKSYLKMTKFFSISNSILRLWSNNCVHW